MFCKEFDCDVITQQDWNQLIIIQRLSFPITQATQLLSGENYATLSLVVPIITATKNKLMAVNVENNEKCQQLKVYFL